MREIRGSGVARREGQKEGEGGVVQKREQEGGCEACIFGK